MGQRIRNWWSEKVLYARFRLFGSPWNVYSEQDGFEKFFSSLGKLGQQHVQALERVSIYGLYVLGGYKRHAEDIRASALLALAEIVDKKRAGSNAEQAISAITSRLGDESDRVSEAAVYALLYIGNKAVPGITRSIDSWNEKLQENAVRTLGYMKKNKAVIVALEKALGSEFLTVRSVAAVSLARLEKDLKATPSLIRGLLYTCCTQSPALVAEAMEVIRKLGAPAVTVLLQILDDGKDGTRRYAARALGYAVKPKTKTGEAVRTLKILAKEQSMAGVEAAIALDRINGKKMDEYEESQRRNAMSHALREAALRAERERMAKSRMKPATTPTKTARGKPVGKTTVRK